MESLIITEILELAIYIFINLLLLLGIYVLQKLSQNYLLSRIAEEAILYVQQVGGKILLDAEKRDEAIKYLIDKSPYFVKKNIDKDQLERVIEATLKRLKLVYGERWKWFEVDIYMKGHKKQPVIS